MTPPIKLTKAQERKVYEVGRKLERARDAMRLSVRGAADRTVTSSRTGRMNQATWRRAELGFIPTSIDGKPVHQVHRAEPETYMAMAEVVGLDGEALCKELGLKPPPPRTRGVTSSSLDQRIDQLTEILEELRQEVRRTRQ